MEASQVLISCSKARRRQRQQEHFDFGESEGRAAIGCLTIAPVDIEKETPAADAAIDDLASGGGEGRGSGDGALPGLETRTLEIPIGYSP